MVPKIDTHGLDLFKGSQLLSSGVGVFGLSIWLRSVL